MKLRILLVSLMVVLLIPGLAPPLAGAQQRDTSINGAPVRPAPTTRLDGAVQPGGTADLLLAPLGPAPPPAEAQPPDPVAKEVSDQDDLYRQRQKGLLSDKQYDGRAPAGSCGPQAGWPGPDGFGYAGQAATYDWVEIGGSGTPVYLGDDTYLGPFPIGFSFRFYDATYTEFYLASNGYMTFGAGSSDFSNDCPLPHVGIPDNMIAMMWDDLDPSAGDPVYYQTFSPCPLGGTPSACLVVQYDNFCLYPGGPGCEIAGTWEAILFETSGRVLLQYQDGGTEQGSGSTTGIEGDSSAWDYGLTYACNTDSSITDSLAIEFLLPTGVVLAPQSAAKAGCENSNVRHTMTLANYTGANGTFALDYVSGWPISGPPSLSLADGESTTFDVVVSIPSGGGSGVATVTASGSGHNDSSTLTTSSTTGGFEPWESVAPINGPARARPAAAAVGGKVYVVGGEIPGGWADTVEEFNPATGLWTTQAGLMPVPASNVCAAAIGTDIYVPGGYDASGTYLSILQVYHTTTDTWETVTSDPLPAPRAGMGCAALDGKLYALGGTDGTYRNTAYVYNPTAPAGSRWSLLPEMIHTRAYLGGAAVNGQVYAVGGLDSATDDLAFVEAYNPADGLWHSVTSMSSRRGGPGAMVWRDYLVVCGGGWSTYLDTCEFYDTTAGYGGIWTTLPQAMTAGRRTFAYASLPDALYAVAGFNGTLLTSAERLPAFGCWAHRLYLPLVTRAGAP